MSASNIFSELALVLRRTISPIRKTHSCPSTDELKSETSKEVPTNKNTKENQGEDRLASKEIHKCTPKGNPIEGDDEKAEGISQTSGALFETSFQHQIRPYAARRSGAQDANEKVY